MTEQKDKLIKERDSVLDQGEAPPQSIPNFTIDDLDKCKTIIDVACKRGAFNANEMTNVGNIYDKLTMFINVQKITDSQTI